MNLSRIFLLCFAGLFFILSCNSGTDSQEESTTNVPEDVVFGTIMDNRDNQSYPTVKIGDQTWLATNLKIKTDSSWCYYSDDMNCKRYGRLYSWEKALTACPEGWHLPSKEEWETLAIHLGSNRQAFETEGDPALYDALKKGGSTHLNLLLSGFYNPSIERFAKQDATGSYWTSTKFGQVAAQCAVMNKGQYETGTFIFSPGSQESGHSCRCLQD